MAQIDSENSITFLAAAEPAGALFFRIDISPEQIFQAIRRLREEARDEIGRLIQFIDKTDSYVSRELEDDYDAEPSLGFQEAFPGRGAGGSGDDRELDLGTSIARSIRSQPVDISTRARRWMRPMPSLRS